MGWIHGKNRRRQGRCLAFPLELQLPYVFSQAAPVDWGPPRAAGTQAGGLQWKVKDSMANFCSLGCEQQRSADAKTLCDTQAKCGVG